MGATEYARRFGGSDWNGISSSHGVRRGEAPTGHLALDSNRER
jgi:hypothetical protein